MNKRCTLFEGSREGVEARLKERLFEGSIGVKGGSTVYLVQGEDCWERNPTSANHRFISK